MRSRSRSWDSRPTNPVRTLLHVGALISKWEGRERTAYPSGGDVPRPGVIHVGTLDGDPIDIARRRGVHDRLDGGDVPWEVELNRASGSLHSEGSRRSGCRRCYLTGQRSATGLSLKGGKSECTSRPRSEKTMVASLHTLSPPSGTRASPLSCSHSIAPCRSWLRGG